MIELSHELSDIVNVEFNGDLEFHKKVNNIDGSLQQGIIVNIWVFKVDSCMNNTDIVVESFLIALLHKGRRIAHDRLIH